MAQRKEQTEMNKLRILIACEESQRVCTEFRKLGHEAYSCDIQEPSGGHPEWHIQSDVTKLLKPNDIGFTEFRTMDGKIHYFNGKFDLMICHPPVYIFNKLCDPKPQPALYSS